MKKHFWIIDTQGRWHPDEGIEDELSMECDSSITEQGLGTSNLFLGM